MEVLIKPKTSCKSDAHSYSMYIPPPSPTQAPTFIPLPFISLPHLSPLTTLTFSLTCHPLTTLTFSLTCHPSQLSPSPSLVTIHNSHLLPHPSQLSPSPSPLTTLTFSLTPHHSHLLPHPSPLTPHHSHLLPHPSPLTTLTILPHPSPLSPSPSPLTPHHSPSPLTPHHSHLLPHPSPLTPHNSHLLPHPSPLTILTFSLTVTLLHLLPGLAQTIQGPQPWQEREDLLSVALLFGEGTVQ